ncbi:MAG: BON domain-containing protein [Thermodesulfobacteriota bacterium]
MTDGEKEILNTLKAALTDRLHLDVRKNPVGLSIEDNAVVMEGVVDGIAAKKRALLMAMGMEGVSGVVDRLKVRPGSAMTDAEIRDHLLRAFTEEPALSRADISVEVTDGVVDIEGRVPSLTHKRLAGVLAWWVPGSGDVINSLIVEPPEKDTDEEIIDALRIVLEKDRLVDAGGVSIIVRVRVRDWTVTLDGVVRSGAEKKAVEEDAWYIWGVNEVINNIIVE